MDDPNVLERMRADWNERAAEDANYYVAFGRREQEEAEFFATAGGLDPGLFEKAAAIPSIASGAPFSAGARARLGIEGTSIIKLIFNCFEYVREFLSTTLWVIWRTAFGREPWGNRRMTAGQKSVPFFEAALTSSGQT